MLLLPLIQTSAEFRASLSFGETTVCLAASANESVILTNAFITQEV